MTQISIKHIKISSRRLFSLFFGTSKGGSKRIMDLEASGGASLGWGGIADEKWSCGDE